MKKLLEQTKFSPREKKMLYFLLCFLLVVGGWFFIITPLLDKGMLLNVEYQDGLMEQSQKQITLLEYATAPAKLKELEAQMVDVLEQYNPPMMNEDIEASLTKIFLEQKLSPKSLVISDAQPLLVGEEQAENNYVMQVQIRVVLSGKIDQFLKTVDAINAMKGMEVAEFSYNVPTDAKVTPSCSMSIMVYMLA